MHDPVHRSTANMNNVREMHGGHDITYGGHHCDNVLAPPNTALTAYCCDAINHFRVGQKKLPLHVRKEWMQPE